MFACLSICGLINELIPNPGVSTLYSSVPLCSEESLTVERFQPQSPIGVFKADLVSVGCLGLQTNDKPGFLKKPGF